MRVLHLVPALNNGGTETMVIQLCRELNKQSCESLIAVFGEGKKKLNSGVNVTHCRNCYVEINLFKPSRINISSYESVVDSYAPTIIHSHSYFTHLIALSNKRKNIKYFFHFHIFYTNLLYSRKESLIGKLKTFSERQLVSLLFLKYSNSKILVVSKALEFYLKKQFPFWLWPKIEIVPNGITIDSNANIVPIKSLDSLQILTVSRLVPEKNLILAITIGQLLKIKGVKFHWSIVGDGELKRELIDLIKKLDLVKEVAIIDKEIDMNAIYQKHNLYVHTADKETFCLSILEAMSFGLPVIVRENLGSEEYLINGVNSIYEKSVDPHIYVRHIMKFKNEPDSYKRITNNGIKTSRNYSIDKYADKIFQLYKK
jgi:glycosyltransferase involved in cell wall biosynthesis